MGCFGAKLLIDGVEFIDNLIVLDTQTLDVILGMDWLSKHKAVLDCGRRAVTVEDTKGNKVEFLATSVRDGHLLVNSLKTVALEDVPIVSEYPDVFPEELPGLPPDRDIEFVIELVPGTAPISKRPYRMPVDELVEMKKQIEELLEKGYVRPSSSP